MRVWKAFIGFIRSNKPDKISLTKSISDKRGFKAAIVVSYKSGLSKSILWGFGLDLAKSVFRDFYKGLLNICPSSPQVFSQKGVWKTYCSSLVARILMRIFPGIA